MTHDLPSTFPALVVDEPGAPFAMRALPMPRPARGEVLVKIAASGVNPLDTKVRAGQAAHARQPLPAVLGIDLAGVVAAVGEGVTAFSPGDRVYGMTGGVGGVQGSLAGFAAVDARLLAHAPARLSMREAAALPLSFITAWEALVDRAGVAPGQSVLVHGAAGGVGHVAVQLAVARGARVFGTTDAASFDVVRCHGAEPIDYRASTVEDYLRQHTGGRGFDVVLDTVGGATLDASFTAVRPHGGHVVSILGWGTHSLAPLSFRAATYSGVFTLLPLITGEGRAHHGEILREATALVDAGRLRPRVDERRFALDTALEAHRLVEGGGARGKVVVDVDPSIG